MTELSRELLDRILTVAAASQLGGGSVWVAYGVHWRNCREFTSDYNNRIILDKLAINSAGLEMASRIRDPGAERCEADVG